MNNEQAIELFVELMRKENKSDNTIKNYVADLKHFEKYLGGMVGGTGLISPQNAIEKYTQWIEKSGLSKTTVNRRISTLKAFYHALEEKGIIDESPAKNLRLKKVANQNETKWLERNQVRAIFEAIDKQKQGVEKRAMQRAIFSLLVNCALRVSELCDIKMDDIDWKSGLIAVVGKGGKFRKVPFNPATQKAVLKWLQYRNMDGDYLFHTERSDHMTPRAVQHMAKRLSESLNFNFTVHQLRHTALKNIADTTGKIEIVASVAGHENVNTSRRYIEPSLAEIGEAMMKSEYDF